MKPSGLAYVALLRGINVGGKNKLPMADLVAMFADAGCTAVRSYIQSGNVVFSASRACAKGLAERISQRIAERFGFRVPVVLRTADELGRVLTSNPYLKRGVDVAWLHVAFLADRPSATRASALNPNRSPGDSFELAGREIYLHLPNGVARTKLANDYFDSTLATKSTLRNWRTVVHLAEMVQSAR